MTHDVLKALALLALLGTPVSGCVLAAGAAAGAVTATELEEDDGKIDPLENTELGEKIYEE